MTHDELKAEIKKHLSTVDGVTHSRHDALSKVFIRHADDCKNIDEAIYSWNGAMVEAVLELEQTQHPQTAGFRTSQTFFRGCPKCKGDLDTRGYCANSNCSEYPGVCY